MKTQNTRLQSNLDLTLMDVLNECRPLIGEDPINRAVGDLATVIEYLHDTAIDEDGCETEDIKEAAKDAATTLEGIVGQFNPLATWTWEDVARELGDVVKSTEDLRDVYPGRKNFYRRNMLFLDIKQAVAGKRVGPLDYFDATTILPLITLQTSEQ
ncbi:hypothetical protein OAI11_00790 [Rhodospirillales bacterium]|nr:hypothetical protein [Rhodospirillales bacterium]